MKLGGLNIVDENGLKVRDRSFSSSNPQCLVRGGIKLEVRDRAVSCKPLTRSHYRPYHFHSKLRFLMTH